MTTATISKVFPRLSKARIATAEARLSRLRNLREVRILRLEDYCRLSGGWGYNTRADGNVSYGDMKNADCPASAEAYLRALSTDDSESGELYFYVPCASGSDYSGSTCERSNYLCFIESYGAEDWVFSAYGGYDTYAACVGLTGLLTCADDTADAILDALEGLEDYPVLDEEALSQLESDLSDESWNNCYARDFERAIEKKFEGCADFDFSDGSALREVFEDLREKCNVYWYNEGSGHDMTVDLDAVVEDIDLDDLAKFTVWYTVTFCDVGTETEDYSAESEAIERVAQLRATGFYGAFYAAAKPVAE